MFGVHKQRNLQIPTRSLIQIGFRWLNHQVHQYLGWIVNQFILWSIRIFWDPTLQERGSDHFWRNSFPRLRNPWTDQLLWSLPVAVNSWIWGGSFQWFILIYLGNPTYCLLLQDRTDYWAYSSGHLDLTLRLYLLVIDPWSVQYSSTLVKRGILTKHIWLKNLNACKGTLQDGSLVKKLRMKTDWNPWN